MNKMLEEQSKENKRLINEAKQTKDFSKVLEALELTRQLVKKLGDEEIKNMEQEINLRF